MVDPGAASSAGGLGAGRTEPLIPLRDQGAVVRLPEPARDGHFEQASNESPRASPDRPMVPEAKSWELSADALDAGVAFHVPADQLWDDPSEEPEESGRECFGHPLQEMEDGASGSLSMLHLGLAATEREEITLFEPDEPASEAQQNDFGPEWDHLDIDAGEFVEMPRPEELGAVSVEGRIARRDRARQVAIALAQRYEWDQRGIELLTEVFDLYWWSAARAAMERQLADGMTVDELETALAVRECWRNHAEFWMDFSRPLAFGSYEGSRATYRTLSWPTALMLVRCGDWLAGVEEIELRLCDLYDDWYGSERLRRVFPAFHGYLHWQLRSRRRFPMGWPEWAFPADGREYGDDEYPPALADSRTGWHVVATAGLVRTRCASPHEYRWSRYLPGRRKLVREDVLHRGGAAKPMELSDSSERNPSTPDDASGLGDEARE